MIVLGIGTKVKIVGSEIEGLIDNMTIENIPASVVYAVRYYFDGEARSITCGEYELTFDTSNKLEIGFK